MARAAVIGAGLMGHGIARVLAAAGHDVVVQDPDRAALVRLDGVERVRLELTLEAAVGDAEWVFEAAPEDLELKRDLFARMDAAAPPGAILASNSSVMRVGDIAARAARPERIVGAHWWNPAQAIPLVEVVLGPATAQDVADRTMELLRAAGKVPVLVRKDVAGFIGNRMQHALWREALSLVESGVCDPEAVDTVVRLGFGRRLGAMGPIENMDYVGLDLTLAIHEYVLPELEPGSPPSERLREMVRRGDLGAKSGRGFLTWTDDRVAEARERLARALTPPASGDTA